MRIVMMGNKLTLVSGHSRPAWQAGRDLQSRGHEARMVVSTTDARTTERHASLVETEGYKRLWAERLEFAGPALRTGESALRKRLAPVLAEADAVHFFDMRALLHVSRMFDGHIGARTILQVSSLPNLTPGDLLKAGWGGAVRALTRVPDAVSFLAPAWAVRRLLRRADELVCTSRFLAETMVQRYAVAANRVGVVYPGVIPIDGDLDELPDRPDYIYFGWPGAHRGTLDAAAAMGRFLQTQPRARCMVSTYRMSRWFGEDALVLRALRGRFARMGVRSVGFLPDIRRRLLGARAAVLPFRSPFGYAQPPVVALEAMAAGVPVISTDVGSVGEVVTDGDNGFLIEARDLDTVAERMNRLWTDADLHRNMSIRAKRTILRKFTLDAMLQGMLRVYERPYDQAN